MPAPEPLPARLIGALFVERGLVSESQIRVALEIQRETGQQLGQVLVERFGVSRKELASVVAEQWAKLGGTSGPEDSASWRRLGEIFVERGFVTEDELRQALTRQRQTGERLGEALVAQGVISKFELAGALAEQMAMLEAPAADEGSAEQPEATVHHLPPRDPDPAEVPFGAVVELHAADEPERVVPDASGDVAVDVGEASGEVEHVAADVGDVDVDGGSAVPDVREVGVETDGVTADVREVVVEAEGVVDDVGDPATEPDDTADLVPEVEPAPAPVEAIAIDDVGHVSLVDAADEAVELAPPEPEPEPGELFEDLRVAIAGDLPSADRLPEQLSSTACLAFVPTTDGYRLVELETPPAPGDTIAVPDLGERLVLRVGRSPLPGDSRLCAYVEEPVTPAPVAALVH